MAGFRLTYSVHFLGAVVVEIPSVLISDENRALLSYYAASSGNFVHAFRDNLSITSSGLKNPKKGVFFFTPGDGAAEV
jgi:hypothetical protein